MTQTIYLKLFNLIKLIDNLVWYKKKTNNILLLPKKTYIVVVNLLVFFFTIITLNVISKVVYEN